MKIRPIFRLRIINSTRYLTNGSIFIQNTYKKSTQRIFKLLLDNLSSLYNKNVSHKYVKKKHRIHLHIIPFPRTGAVQVQPFRGVMRRSDGGGGGEAGEEFAIKAANIVNLKFISDERALFLPLPLHTYPHIYIHLYIYYNTFTT